MVTDEKTPGRSVSRRILLAAVALLSLGALIGGAFLPWSANHFGYALPNSNGLPYRVHYNNRDYHSVRTCAGAAWCEKASDSATMPYCVSRAALDARNASLVHVDDVPTLFGPSHGVFITSAAKPNQTALDLLVEDHDDCYVPYALMGGP